MKPIQFNIPFVAGKELSYIKRVINDKKLTEGAYFTKECISFFRENFGFKKTFLTSSATNAFELISLACNIKEGDEIIIPSFTFVSSANPFLLRGAKIIFADSQIDNPNLDTTTLAALITKKTKAIVPVHYGGVACAMKELLVLAKQHELLVIEDAAHAIDAYYNNKPLGSFGDFSAISFHETKNITAGEAGLAIINNLKYFKKIEILKDKGTNKAEFLRGKIKKYDWIDVGSSFLASEITAAFLFSQLEKMQDVLAKRTKLWQFYYNELKYLEKSESINLPSIPSYSKHNAHIFYIICKTNIERERLIKYLWQRGIQATFHYQALHKSKYFYKQHDGRKLHNAERFSECLLRLPLYYNLNITEAEIVVNAIKTFYSIN